MKQIVSTVTTPRIERSRRIRPICCAPGKSTSEGMRDRVSMLRRSMRPCPLSTVSAVRRSALMACLSRGERLAAERVVNLGSKRFLIVFDGPEVIAALFNNLLRQVALGKNRVAGHDAAFHRNQPQQFE